MKKAIALILVIIMSFGCFSSVSFAEGTDTETEIEYIEVYDVEDLYCVRNDLTANYILMNDIDLTEATAAGGDWDFNSCGWDPIGSGGIYDDNAFSGVFDGNGHSITGLRIELNSVTSDTYYIYAGLFGYVTGTVKNLTVEGSFGGNLNRSTRPYDIYIGSIAGYNAGSIENCISLVDFDMNFSHTYSSSSSYTNYYDYDINIGGINGYNRGNIKHCVNSGNINIGVESRNDAVHSACISGISGYNANTVSECVNSADLISLESRNSDSGYRSMACGIATNGTYIYNGSTLSRGKITNCYNMADATVNNNYTNYGVACGIGYNVYGSDSKITSNCYNIGTVTSSNSSSFAYAIGDSYLTDCYYLSGTGTNTSGAVALTSAQLKLQSIFKGWDFENVWTMEGSNDYYYPELRNVGLILPFTATLSVEGEYITGNTLTATVSEVTPENAKYVIEWLVDGKVVATGESYKIKYSDFDKALSVRVRGTDGYNGLVACEGQTVTGNDHIHNEIIVEAVAATCTEKGYTEGIRCSECNEILEGCEEIPATGHEESEIAEVEPTCTKNGLTSGKRCKVCGIITVEQEVIKAKGHTEVDMGVYKEPSCSEEGSTEGKQCSVCGTITRKPQAIAKLTHTFGEWIITKEPTCTSEGAKETSCLICNETVTEAIPYAAHTEITVEPVNPSCTSNGRTAGVVCEVCGAIIKGCEEISAMGHNFKTTKATEPTCTEKGYYSFECTRCGKTDEKYPDAMGHDFNKSETCKRCGEKCTHNYEKWETIEPTCTKEGCRYSYCTVCDLKKTEYIDAFGHKAVPNKIDKVPTCTTEGHYIDSVCSRCGIIIEGEGSIPALGHDWSKEYMVIKPATCAEEGMKAICCKRCGAHDEKTVIKIEKLEHTWSKDYKVIKKETCEEEGMQAIWCEMCGKVKEGTEIVRNKLPHNFKKDWQTLIPATCTTTGTSIRICVVCSAFESRVDNILEHIDTDGDSKCDVCSADLSSGTDPDDPTEDPADKPDEDPSKNCSCNCHKGGIAGFFFDFILFFQKLFKTNKTCACGIAHY